MILKEGWLKLAIAQKDDNLKTERIDKIIRREFLEYPNLTTLNGGWK